MITYFFLIKVVPKLLSELLIAWSTFKISPSLIWISHPKKLLETKFHASRVIINTHTYVFKKKRV